MVGRPYNWGGLWTPQNTKLQGWWDASDTSAFNINQSGGLVSLIRDKSGNGHHLVQATGSLQPITNSRTINGLNVLDFDGIGDRLKAAGFVNAASGDSMTIGFAVVDSFGNANQSMWSHDGAFVNDYQFESSDATGFRFGIDDQNLNGFEPGDTGPNSFSDNGPTVYASILDFNDLGTFNGWASGVANDTGGSVYTIKINTTVEFTLCANRNENQFVNGAIAEVAIVEGVNSTLRQQFEGYYAHKWQGAGGSNTLPVAHPYKNFPPTVGVVTV